MVKTFLILVVFFFSFISFSTPVLALDCTSNPNICPSGQHCIDPDNDNKFTCESLGPGLTAPKCRITFKAPGVVGKQLPFQIDAGDNGETFFKQPSPNASVGCGPVVGFCGSGNLCTNFESGGFCSNVCGRTYANPRSTGTCTISATVFNNAGSTTCSQSITVACPKSMIISGSLTGNPGRACVEVYDITTGNQLKGTYCGRKSWTSGELPSGRNYQVLPKPIDGYSVSPARYKFSNTCEDEGGANFKYKCVTGAECRVTPPPVVTTPPEAVTTPAGVVTPITTSNSYFQTVGGNVTAIGSVSDGNLPASEAISMKSTGHQDAGTILASAISIPVNSLFSKSGNNSGWNLRSYEFTGRVPTYLDSLNIVLRNAGYSSLSDLDCHPGQKVNALNGKFRFWCYSGTGGLNAALSDAINSDDTDKLIRVLIPTSSGPVKLQNEYKFVNNLKPNERTMPILLFVDPKNGELIIEKDLEVDANNSNSLFLAIVNGPVITKQEVKQADGVFVFNGKYSNGGGNLGIKGLGSLLGSGEALSAGFIRNLPKSSGPAENWTYDGRYLNMFKNVLSRPGFLWQELSPE